MPSRTLAAASETTASGHKKVKDRIYLLACLNATGSHKLPSLLIKLDMEKDRPFSRRYSMSRLHKNG